MKGFDLMQGAFKRMTQAGKKEVPESEAKLKCLTVLSLICEDPTQGGPELSTWLEKENLSSLLRSQSKLQGNSEQIEAFKNEYKDSDLADKILYLQRNHMPVSPYADPMFSAGKDALPEHFKVFLDATETAGRILENLQKLKAKDDWLEGKITTFEGKIGEGTQIFVGWLGPAPSPVPKKKSMFSSIKSTVHSVGTGLMNREKETKKIKTITDDITKLMTMLRDEIRNNSQVCGLNDTSLAEMTSMIQEGHKKLTKDLEAAVAKEAKVLKNLMEKNHAEVMNAMKANKVLYSVPQCCTCSRTLLALVLYSLSYSIYTQSRTVLALVLHLLSYCTRSRTLLTLVLYTHTVLTLVLYSLSYCTHSRTLVTRVLYSLSYCTHSRTLLALDGYALSCCVLTLVLYWFSYSTHSRTLLALVLYARSCTVCSLSHATHSRTLRNLVLSTLSYCTHSRTLLALVKEAIMGEMKNMEENNGKRHDELKTMLNDMKESNDSMQNMLKGLGAEVTKSLEEFGTQLDDSLGSMGKKVDEMVSGYQVL
jgi:hypothetical protein